MAPTQPNTGFARLSRPMARGVLVATLLMVLFCIGVSLSSQRQGFADQPNRGAGDVALYAAVTERVHAGENYYSVASEELRERGYPTKSVFNWRTPLPMWLIGILPDPALGKGLLCLLGLGLLLCGFELTAREAGTGASLWGALLMLGALLPCLLGELFVMPMLWAGVLIALSLGSLALGKERLGVVLGIAALFVRDLAGPYCAFALVYALWKRKRREALGWAVGLAAYAVFFAWHTWQVSGHQTPDDVAHAKSWLQFGGTAYLLSLTQMNGFLLLLPQWVSAIFFPLALLGFASWQGEIGQRIGLTAMMFVLLFSVVGMPINQYWGSLIAPLFCLGAARAPWAIRDLWRVAEWNRSSQLAVVNS